jgi:hypothetical protein
LLLPQVRPLAQLLSRSQSPSPTLQGLDVEQQFQSVVGLPSHDEGDGVGAGGAVGLIPNIKCLEKHAY